MVHVETLERNAQSRQAYRKETQARNDIAISLHSSLESLLQGDMTRLFKEVGAFDTLLVNSIRLCPGASRVDYYRNGSHRG